MRRKPESGLTIPLLALFMVVLIIMMALAIDVGVLYTARTSAQHAADASALAGAFTYITSPTASNPGATATAAALSAAIQNKILGAAVPASEVTVTPNPPLVTVSISHIAPTFFARVMGSNQAKIAVTATAQAGPQVVGTSCLRPFWILRSCLSGTCGVCDGSTPTPGQSVQLHDQTNPNCSNYSTASQWGFIDEAGGASAIEKAILSCENSITKCGTAVPIETGNISAINRMNPPPEFFGPSTGCPLGVGQDCFYGVSDYSIGGPSGPRSSSSQSVVTVAILDDCGGQVPPPPGTTGTLNIVAFGQVFINGIQGNGNSCVRPLTISTNLVSFDPCGNGNSGGGGGNVGNYAVPVRLVQ